MRVPNLIKAYSVNHLMCTDRQMSDDGCLALKLNSEDNPVDYARLKLEIKE
ncbi:MULTISPECIES: hypothetical protein [unclassified Streptococcus]|uniref:hypothetical protein n=1 Tax=unclassified Streptococcus TaxID=2608887 RepID=UPI001430F688|nr:MULTISPECIES: hypothetical protein [unclassified Streptococcus]MBF0787737.1 hypothetical protein [Streptococcus sp. 19428wC2_LYSM12]MCQ9211549.1 hypothetical protein [Streptococcus sp. B01]MCQ9214865.1 hypothetical protein [Streptococcus sp. O1]